MLLNLELELKAEKDNAEAAVGDMGRPVAVELVEPWHGKEEKTWI